MSLPERRKYIEVRALTPQEKARATRRAKKEAGLFVMRVINRATDVYVYPFIERTDTRGGFHVTTDLSRAVIFGDRERVLLAANELNRTQGQMYVFEPVSVADARRDGCLCPDLARRYHALLEMPEHTPMEADFLRMLMCMKGGYQS